LDSDVHIQENYTSLDDFVVALNKKI
jgi:hypothetical protein